MIKPQVGKKYLDVAGREWEVTGIMNTPTETLYGVKGGGLTTWCPAASLVSEVPATPQFKVGDRVYVCGVGDALPGTVVEVLLKLVNVLIDGEPKYTVCYPYELTLLTDDTTPTYVPTCTCETFLLMREGCRCGRARVAIEQEFKREGWR